MANLERIFNYNGVNVRIDLDDAGEPWFVTKDVCDVLNISFSGQTLTKIPDTWQGVMSFITPGGMQNFKVINEKAVYKLAFRSNKPEAEAFTEWVCSEVLPSIRKTGSYGCDLNLSAVKDDKIIMALIQGIIQQKENEKRLTKVESRLDNLNGETGYRTIRAYLTERKRALPLNQMNALGRKASSYCRLKGIQIGKVPDERHGQVNSYPIEVLDELSR